MNKNLAACNYEKSYLKSGHFVLGDFVIWSITDSLKSTEAIKSLTDLTNSSARKGKKIVLFDGSTLNGWIQVPANSWVIKDSTMASTGAGRGYIFTRDDYAHYCLTFSVL